VGGQPAGFGQGAAQQELDLGVGAAQLVVSPSDQGVMNGGIQAQQYALRSVTTIPCLPSLVQGAGVDDLLGSLLAAQDHKQVRDHRGLPLLVQRDHALFLQLLQGQMDHADGTLDDA
jgi:hypothetical protein